MKRIFVLLAIVLAMTLGFSGLVSAEVGVTDKEIVFGTHSDLSGPIASWGVPWTDGLKMGAAEINERGGIFGRKIRLVIEDNAYDPKKAILATNKLISRDKVFAFVANMGSPTAGATKPIISRKKIPQMIPATAASLFFDPFDRYSFAGWTPYYDQARGIVTFMWDRGSRKFGVLYQDDEMGSIMMKGFKDQMKVYGTKLTLAESYKRGATSFASQIAKLKKANVDIILMATVVRETVGALKEVKKIGWDIQMAGLSPTLTQFVPMLAKKAGINPDGYIAAGNTPLLYEGEGSQCARDFWDRHVKRFGKDPQQPTTAGYYSMDIIAEALKRVGKNLTREKFIDALETFDNYSDKCFGGPPLNYNSKSHQGMSAVIVQQVKDGKFRTISTGYVNYKK